MHISVNERRCRLSKFITHSFKHRCIELCLIQGPLIPYLRMKTTRRAASRPVGQVYHRTLQCDREFSLRINWISSSEILAKFHKTFVWRTGYPTYLGTKYAKNCFEHYKRVQSANYHKDMTEGLRHDSIRAQRCTMLLGRYCYCGVPQSNKIPQKLSFGATWSKMQTRSTSTIT